MDQSSSLAFVDEMKTFPYGKYKDQMDAAGGAFAKLAMSQAVGILM